MRGMRPVHALAIAAAIAVATPAHAHVAPAVGDNNRYLKLTAMGDRLRLAYTIFYGEVPGGALRQTLDANRDGALDDRETQPLGERVARDVAAAVHLSVDHLPQPIVWSQVVVGLGTPSARGGAFSIDLVAWICAPSGTGAHALSLRDGYAIDRPGETEVKLEDSPGVAITASHIGGADDEQHDYKLVGPSGALETSGLDATYTIDGKAPRTHDAVCAAPAADRPFAIIAAIAIIAAAIAALAIYARLRRRRRATDGRRAAGSKRRRASDRR